MSHFSIEILIHTLIFCVRSKTVMKSWLFSLVVILLEVGILMALLHSSECSINKQLISL